MLGATRSAHALHTLSKGYFRDSYCIFALGGSGKFMVLEVAILDVKAGQEEEFERAFQVAQAIISAMAGYISHQLQRCIEQQSRYILLVNWQSLEAHTQGFRGSSQYQEWKALLHHFYSPFPEVQHYQLVTTRADASSSH